LPDGLVPAGEDFKFEKIIRLNSIKVNIFFCGMPEQHMVLLTVLPALSRRGKTMVAVKLYAAMGE